MAQRERHYSCFNLNALVVVEMDILVNYFSLTFSCLNYFLDFW